MGFSVSGSAAVIFVATFVGFGMFYSATTNSMELVNDARDDQQERLLEQENTAIRLAAVEYNSTSDWLNVTVVNTGATELAVSDVDLLADNSYVVPDRTDVDDDAGTDLWLPRETLRINASVASNPSLVDDPGRVKLVTGPGIAATGTTTVVV